MVFEIFEGQVAPVEGVGLVAGDDPPGPALVRLVDPDVVATIGLLDDEECVVSKVLGLGEAKKGAPSAIDLLVDDVEGTVGDPVSGCDESAASRCERMDS